VGEILEEFPTRGSDKWTMTYRIRRDDGEEVAVMASATATVEAMLKRDDADPEARQFVQDRGRSAALKHAEQAQSPKLRGNTLIVLFVDPLSALLTGSYEYELPRCR
jgi:hypothetical protein